MAATDVGGPVTAPAETALHRAGREGGVGEPRRVGYLYVLPALLVYGLFLLFPLLHSGWLSLFDWDGLSLGMFTGLSNYARLFGEEGAGAAFGHVAVLLIFFAVLPVSIGLVLATALHRV
ncbi:carbohydrate ABC transporter permease, partial [Kibdelosporangium lantanae]